MSIYKTAISKATGVTDNTDLAEIEDYMRHSVFHSTLDWISPKQFNKGAKTAWNDIQWIRSDEGKAYMDSLTAQYGL